MIGLRRFAVALVAVAATVVPPFTQAAADAAGCSLTSTGGTVTRMLGTRTYNINVPAGLTGTQVPLLLALHGGGTSAEMYEELTLWSDYAAGHNFIVAYPQGIAGTWASAKDSYDVTFLRAVVDDIAATWCIDPRRVHAEGWSQGGIMADRLACESHHKFASVGSFGAVPANTFGSSCDPTRAVATAWFYSAGDSWEPLAREGVAFWVANNNCPTTPIHTVDSLGYADLYTPCDLDTQVLWRLYDFPQTHWPPQGENGVDYRNRIWSFFQVHPLP